MTTINEQNHLPKPTGKNPPAGVGSNNGSRTQASNIFEAQENTAQNANPINPEIKNGFVTVYTSDTLEPEIRGEVVPVYPVNPIEPEIRGEFIPLYPVNPDEPEVRNGFVQVYSADSVTPEVRGEVAPLREIPELPDWGYADPNERAREELPDWGYSDPNERAKEELTTWLSSLKDKDGNQRFDYSIKHILELIEKDDSKKEILQRLVEREDLNQTVIRKILTVVNNENKKFLLPLLAQKNEKGEQRYTGMAIANLLKVVNEDNAAMIGKLSAIKTEDGKPILGGYEISQIVKGKSKDELAVLEKNFELAKKLADKFGSTASGIIKNITADNHEFINELLKQENLTADQVQCFGLLMDSKNQNGEARFGGNELRRFIGILTSENMSKIQELSKVEQLDSSDIAQILLQVPEENLNIDAIKQLGNIKTADGKPRFSGIDLWELAKVITPENIQQIEQLAEIQQLDGQDIRYILYEADGEDIDIDVLKQLSDLKANDGTPRFSGSELRELPKFVTSENVEKVQQLAQIQQIEVENIINILQKVPAEKIDTKALQKLGEMQTADGKPKFSGKEFERLALFATSKNLPMIKQVLGTRNLNAYDISQIFYPAIRTDLPNLNELFQNLEGKSDEEFLSLAEAGLSEALGLKDQVLGVSIIDKDTKTMKAMGAYIFPFNVIELPNDTFTYPKQELIDTLAHEFKHAEQYIHMIRTLGIDRVAKAFAELALSRTIEAGDIDPKDKRALAEKKLVLENYYKDTIKENYAASLSLPKTKPTKEDIERAEGYLKAAINYDKDMAIQGQIFNNLLEKEAIPRGKSIGFLHHVYSDYTKPRLNIKNGKIEGYSILNSEGKERYRIINIKIKEEEEEEEKPLEPQELNRRLRSVI